MTDDEADYIGDCVFDDMAWFLINGSGLYANRIANALSKGHGRVHLIGEE